MTQYDRHLSPAHISSPSLQISWPPAAAAARLHPRHPPRSTPQSKPKPLAGFSPIAIARVLLNVLSVVVKVTTAVEAAILGTAAVGAGAGEGIVKICRHRYSKIW